MRVSGPITLASRNAGKLREIRELVGTRLDLISPPDDVPEVVEDGSNYFENARLKAVAVAGHVRGWALADDSGLEVDALGGRPGVHSARYGGGDLDDQGRCARLLEELAGAASRSARFCCVLVLAEPSGELVTAKGSVEGKIADAPRGGGGFGYDPIFLPERFPGRTLAEVTSSEKGAISHRAVALRSLLDLLAT